MIFCTIPGALCVTTAKMAPDGFYKGRNRWGYYVWNNTAELNFCYADEVPTNKKAMLEGIPTNNLVMKASMKV